MTIALVARHLYEWDAIGNDVLGMARALRKAGHPVELYAERARVREHVQPLDALQNLPLEDLVIYHHANRCDEIVPIATARPQSFVLRYHNITPAHFFAEDDPGALRNARIGIRQAKQVAQVARQIWVPSRFNALDFPDASQAKTEILPPFHQVDDLRLSAADSMSIGGLDSWATTILCVGRIAPNKNLLLTMDAFAHYCQEFDPQARLVLVGEHTYPRYSEKLEIRAKELGIENRVTATGRLTTAQLKAVYLAADALVVTSEHEGFCVPLLEAMSLGVPVVAVANAAIPETAGEAACFVRGNLTELAEGIRNVVEKDDVRRKQILAGRQRYREQFATEKIDSRLQELMRVWVESPLLCG